MSPRVIGLYTKAPIDLWIGILWIFHFLPDNIAYGHGTKWFCAECSSTLTALHSLGHVQPPLKVSLIPQKYS